MPNTITAAPPAIPIVLTGKNNAERMKEITDKLEQGIKDLFSSDRYAVAAIRSGDDIKTVQGNLGHATASFTLDVYGHVTEQMKRESADRMQQYIDKIQKSG